MDYSVEGAGRFGELQPKIGTPLPWRLASVSGIRNFARALAVKFVAAQKSGMFERLIARAASLPLRRPTAKPGAAPPWRRGRGCRGRRMSNSSKRPV